MTEIAINRILDANFNRASEAVRVIEDCTRFALGDLCLSRRAKNIRHSLAEILQRFSILNLVRTRDAEEDVGREISIDSEYARSSVADLLTANLKRLQQALRSLEEAGKIVDEDAANRFEHLRYETYSLEKAILTTIASQRLLDDINVCVLVDGLDSSESFRERVSLLIEAGVKFFQLRDKQLADRQLVERGRILSELAGHFEFKWVMNDRADLAEVCGAEGVHLGQDDLPVGQARKILGPEKWIGVSTHSLQQARQAVADGADYLGVGPVFPSTTKSFESFPGLELVENVAQEISLPAFAIGGIDGGNVDRVFTAGLERVAVSGWIAELDSVEAVRNGLKQLAVLRSEAFRTAARQSPDTVGVSCESKLSRSDDFTV